MDKKDLSTALTLVRTIIQLLNFCTAIQKKIVSKLRNKSDLRKLIETMYTIQNELRDADEQERQQMQPCNVLKNKLNRLKEVVYQADDLFDEVATLAHSKKLIPGSKVSKEVHLFFTRFNQLRSAFTTSREIADIRSTLLGIESDHNPRLTEPYHPTCETKFPRETHSHVNRDQIIGREKDKKKVTEMLLKATLDSDDDVPVVAIVGIGGLGKTALAQLIYNDEKIHREFPLRMWVWVSRDFEIKLILKKILQYFYNGRIQDDPDLEFLQTRVRQILDGKKYLLVLDDIWNEDPNEWHRLRNLLVPGDGGSRIIVTTRSRSVGRIVANRQLYELQGLAEQDSWDLFSRMAFERGQTMEASMHNIGRDIVQNCANVPLAIREAGSLVRGQDASSWGGQTIMDVLRLSYTDLPFYLKCCFSYCAIFPKNSKVMKEDLICLWMAQGLIKPSSDEAHNLEKKGDEYFDTLLNKCFFKEVERADDGKILSCKVHDLIHDVAKQVAGVEIVTLSSKHNKGNSNHETRHLFVDYTAEETDIKSLFTKTTRMRTLFLHKTLNTESNSAMSKVRRYLGGSHSEEVGLSTKNLHVFLSKVRYLRALDLQGIGLNIFPDIIDELLHLRYIDLSCNYFEKLPNIKKLYNLQTLKLRNCCCLKKLPRELSKLVNLRHLDIHGCTVLKRMPPGLNKMESLHKLTAFVVSGKKKKLLGGILKSKDVGKLGDLNPSVNRSDFMEVVISKDVDYKKVEAREGGYLLNNQHLKEITISWRIGDDKNGNDNKNAEAMLEALKPNSNLKKLVLKNYPGHSFHAWSGSLMNLKICLPNLVKLRISRCERLKHLPLMSELCHLRILQLDELKELEYVERSNSAGSRRTVGDNLSMYFPSLEQLKLIELPKLKGWLETSSHSISFPMLSHLDIDRCDNLNCAKFPHCPTLKILLPVKYKLYLLHLVVEGTNSEQITIEERRSQASPLGSFKHITCRKTLSGLEKREDLSAVEILEIRSHYTLELDDADMPWRCFAPTLRSLTLDRCTIVKLPKGMSFLTSLQILVISYCSKFNTLPTWISCLSCLQSFTIKDCGNLHSLPKEMRLLTTLRQLSLEGIVSRQLYERCKKPHGMDWPNIQHIFQISLNNEVQNNSLR